MNDTDVALGNDVQSDRRFRLLAEAIPQIVWTAGPDGHRDYLNGRWTDFTGLSREQSLGDRWMDAVHPDDRDRFRSSWSAAASSATPFEIEYRLRSADGSCRWFLVRAEPILDDDGHAVRWFGTSTDIDDRIRTADRKLRDSEERLRASIDALIDCFGIYSAIRDDRGRIVDFRIDYVNHPACLNNRLTREEQLGRGLLEILPAHRESGLFERYCRVVETGEPLDIEEIVFEDAYGGERIGRAFAIRVGRLGDGFVAAWRDITDRKRAERALGGSEERFRMAAEAVGGLIYEWDVATGRVLRTDGMSDLTGFRPDEAEPTADWWNGRIHPDDRGLLRAVYRKCLATREPLLEAQYRLQHRDGTYRHVWDRARAVYDGDGRLVRCVGFTMDVTPLRSAEIALRESETRLQTLAASNVIGVIFGNVGGGISYANDEFLRIVAYPREEFEAARIGWASVTPPEWLEVDERAIAEARAAGGSCTPYEKEYRRRDGTRIPVLVGFTLFGADETVAFILDLSERKSAEREICRLNRDLEHRAALLQTLFDVLPVGIGIAEDPDCRFIATNPALARILHIPPDANASLSAPDDERPAAFRVFQDGKELGPDELPMQRAAAHGDSFHDVELDLVYPDGSTTKLLEYVAPLLDPDGRPRGSVGAYLDITARKQTEAALREADRRKDEALAVLAHELRNPLATIGNALHLLGAPGVPDGERDLACQVAERQMKNLARLVDDLLDVSRIASGKVDLKMERLDAATVVTRAVESVRPFIEGRRHQLVLSLAPGDMPIAGDPTRLEQILANLLSNATKYSDPGSRITVSAAPEGGEVAFRVRDTGIGIAAEMLPTVFDMFAQVDSSRDRSHGGLGIGLRLVRELTELHGGRVSATSDGPGRGSEFVVRLPLLATDDRPATPDVIDSPADATGRARPRRILLVDDNADTLWSTATLLKFSGHEVVTARDGPSAIEAAGGSPPDVAILDLGLPGMSGHELAEALRRGAMTGAVLIAVSGYAQPEDRERSRRAGFDHHLSKPVDFETLLALIG